MLLRLFLFFFFFFNDTATTEIYTLSLHDALPISTARSTCGRCTAPPGGRGSDPRCAGASWSGRTCCRRATTTPITGGGRRSAAWYPRTSLTSLNAAGGRFFSPPPPPPPVTRAWKLATPRRRHCLHPL